MFTVRAHWEGQALTMIAPLATEADALEALDELYAEHTESGVTVDAYYTESGDVIASMTHE